MLIMLNNKKPKTPNHITAFPYQGANCLNIAGRQYHAGVVYDVPDEDAERLLDMEDLAGNPEFVQAPRNAEAGAKLAGNVDPRVHDPNAKPDAERPRTVTRRVGGKPKANPGTVTV